MARKRHSEPAASTDPVRVDARLLSTVVEALRPEPILLVSEWADRFRILPPSSAEPGQWRTDRAPHTREVMDALSVHRVDVCEVVLMWATQLAKSEVLNNWIGYIIDIAPSPILVVQPTEKTAQKYMRSRIRPMIESCPRLKRAIAAARKNGGADNLDTKDFPGGELTMAGGNAPAGIASMPKRFVGFDEVGRFPPSAGDEGDVMTIARRRTATYARSKVFAASSPGIAGQCQIEARYLQGDRRKRFVPCPHCGHFQHLRLGKRDGTGGLVWLDGRPDDVKYQCEACGCLIDHGEKTAMLLLGEWRPTCEAQVPGLQSYQLSSLYSPWMSWSKLVAEFLACGNDPAKLKVFVNTLLGETWADEQGGGVSVDAIYARREMYAADVPGPVQVLTAGVDIQDDRIEVSIWGWGYAEEAWAVAHAVLDGSPESPEVWEHLDLYLRSRWLREDGRTLLVQAVAVDTGYKPQPVYTFCRDRFKRRVWAVKGMSGQGDLWPKRPPKKLKKSDVRLYGIRHDAAKEALWARLRSQPGGPGTVHLPAAMWCTQDWCRQLTTERPKWTVNKRTGQSRRQWVKAEGKRNEAWDCFVYAYAALHGLIRLGLRLVRPASHVRPAAQPAPVDTPVLPADRTNPTPQPPANKRAPATRTKMKEKADPRRFAH